MIGSDVIVADYAGLRLLRFGARGEPRGELMVPEIIGYADEVRATRTHYRRLQSFLWVVFAGALVLGFAVAINDELSRRREKDVAQNVAKVTAATVSESEPPTPNDPGIHWIPLAQAFRRQFRLLLIVMTVILIGSLLLFIPLYDKFNDKPESAIVLAGLYALLIASTVAIWFGFRRMMRSLRVGVIREWVLLRGLANRFAIGRGDDIGIAPNAIVIADVSVPTGGRKLSIFAPDEWAKWVEPRLTHARKLTVLDMMRWSWKHQRAINLAAIGGLVLLLVAWPWLH